MRIGNTNILILILAMKDIEDNKIRGLDLEKMENQLGAAEIKFYYWVIYPS